MKTWIHADQTTGKIIDKITMTEQWVIINFDGETYTSFRAESYDDEYEMFNEEIDLNHLTHIEFIDSGLGIEDDWDKYCKDSHNKQLEAKRLEYDRLKNLFEPNKEQA